MDSRSFYRTVEEIHVCFYEDGILNEWRKEDKRSFKQNFTRNGSLVYHLGLCKCLIKGSFIDWCKNILIFGNFGTGKSHLCIGLAGKWCLQGRRVLYITASQLVQYLLASGRSLKLSEAVKKPDCFEVLIIDDISY